MLGAALGGGDVRATAERLRDAGLPVGVYLDPHAPVTNYMLGVALSGGDVMAAARAMGAVERARGATSSHLRGGNPVLQVGEEPPSCRARSAGERRGR